MTEIDLDLLTFARQLRSAFCHETSELPDRWHPGNPSIGQCQVSAINMRIQFGGRIVYGWAVTQALKPHAGTEHFWNVIDGITVDITRDQFMPWTNFVYGGLASAPNATTVAKAQLLAKLAGIEETRAA